MTISNALIDRISELQRQKDFARGQVAALKVIADKARKYLDDAANDLFNAQREVQELSREIADITREIAG